ncbi:MAG: hypothetical protein AAF558_12340 [Verrucomicrobiota bacterium]
MIKLNSSRVIQAPRWLCFELIRNVDVHAAAVPEIKARPESGRKSGALHFGECTEWSAIYFGVRFRITMEVTDFDWPIRYAERNRRGLFQVFQHNYQLASIDSNRTVLNDCLSFESGYGPLGRYVDEWILAPRLSRALETRMTAIKTWAEDGSWREWISDEDAKQLIPEETI